MRKDVNIRYGHIRWKKKDTFGMALIFCLGIIMAPLSFMIRGIYDIFFNICLGLFIGGIMMTFISFFLAQMESNISGEGDIDIDTDVDVDIDVDADVDIDVDADVDIDIDVDADVDIDIDADADIDVDSDVDVDSDLESEVDTDVLSDITPAPIMLLISTALLFFGISGILLYYYVPETFRFIIFFITPIFTYIITKLTNFFWKKIAKSRYYAISSTKNLIGVQGEVILTVDYISGLIKIKSETPMKFEKVPVKPLNPNSVFERGEKVYICTTRQGILLVDNKAQSIQKKIKKNYNKI